MSTALVVGCTGAVGSEILSALLTAEAFTSVKTISRRIPAVRSPKLESLQEAEITKWGAMISHLSPKPTVVFNAVGATRHVGIQNQWKIDHDSVIENAKAAKAAGVKTYVFISSGGTAWYLASYLPYLKMKIGAEKAIRELGFEQAIILKPGLIIGREQPKTPWLEAMVESVTQRGPGVMDRLAQDQSIIGRAAVAAARIAGENKAPSKIWVLEVVDILKLGRDEWQE